MKIKLFFALFGIIFCFTACKSDKQNTTSKTVKINDAPQWVGTYKGVVPCDGCDGIERVLTLHANSTYDLHIHYLGTRTKRWEKGILQWQKTGDIFSLIRSGQKATASYLLYKGNLMQLKKDGKLLSGTIRPKYTLKRVHKD